MEATYWPEPQFAFAERRRLYLEYCAAQSSSGRAAFFSQIVRLELGGPALDEGPIREALAYVDRREDCSDFLVAGLLRILYRYRTSPLLSPALAADIEACLLRFKYWWDEPGADPMCYFTENHQIIFHSGELLAGQLFRKHTFANSGLDGEAHMAHVLPFIYRWFGWRVRFGFSEWLSNCYIDEDLLGLVNLYDFAEDPLIRRQAGLMIDLLLFEMALHSYRGVLGCTHGRTYAPMIKGGRGEGTASTSALMLGLGLFNNPASLSAVSLATSGYRCPPLIEAIAADRPATLLCHERHSLDVDEAPAHGLRYDDLGDGLYFWTIQTYFHPRVLALSRRMQQLYGSRLTGLYEAYSVAYDRQKAVLGPTADGDLDKTALTAVNIETWRTPDYQLSCAQSYRPGLPGYQQHPWQATLGLDAVVFTNHPGAGDESGASRPNYWAGNGLLPRAAQHRNVLVCLHRIPPGDPFPFSHAYFPWPAFDEVAQSGHWLAARKGEGLVALYSQYPAYRPSGPHHDEEWRCDARDNVWLCELGSTADWGSLAGFLQAVSARPVDCVGLHVRYASPSQGPVEFSWEGPLRVRGEVVPLRGYKRFDNPYCQCELGAPDVAIRHGGEELKLDWTL